MLVGEDVVPLMIAVCVLCILIREILDTPIIFIPYVDLRVRCYLDSVP